MVLQSYSLPKEGEAVPAPQPGQRLAVKGGWDAGVGARGLGYG